MRLVLRERRDHALALFLDVFRKPGMTLVDETGGKTELQKRNGERRGEIVQVRARLRKLQSLDRLVEKLLHGVVELFFE